MQEKWKENQKCRRNSKKLRNVEGNRKMNKCKVKDMEVTLKKIFKKLKEIEKFQNNLKMLKSPKSRKNTNETGKNLNG